MAELTAADPIGWYECRDSAGPPFALWWTGHDLLRQPAGKERIFLGFSSYRQLDYLQPGVMEPVKAQVVLGDDVTNKVPGHIYEVRDVAHTADVGVILAGKNDVLCRGLEYLDRGPLQLPSLPAVMPVMPSKPVRILGRHSRGLAWFIELSLSGDGGVQLIDVEDGTAVSRGQWIEDGWTEVSRD